MTAPEVLLLLLAVASIRPAAGAVRFARCSGQAKRHYPAMIWARLRWRWLARHTGLARLEVQDKGRGMGQAKFHYPRARFRADDFGWQARVKTVPKVGRTQFEDAADHVANAWRCHRVSVTQAAPGRLVFRGMRRDPLAEPFGIDGTPAGIYGEPDPSRLYLGRDEFGADRWAELGGLTGITVVGLPGYGKTSCVGSWLCQLAGTDAVQFCFIDLKGGGDYLHWSGRAWISVGDELPEVAGALEDVHSLMRSRLSKVGRGDGPRNRWHVGPTPEYPLIVTIVDECHGAFDLDAVKSDKQAEGQVRACRALTGQLIKKGRSVLFLTILLTQKGTSDAVPTALRDNCGLGFSFAVKTRDAAVAGLGEAIKEYPGYCPTTLRDRSMIGVATASLPTGSDPFVRIRVPEITEAAAAARAKETEHFRCDPTANTNHGSDLVVVS